MQRIFRFASKESFKSSASSQFAEQLLLAPAATREGLRRMFGLTIDVSSDPIRTKHDGQRVGVGGFRAKNHEVQFVVGPKAGIKISELTQALDDSEYWGNFVEYDRDEMAGASSNRDSEFSPAFLISLLHRIAEYAQRHDDPTHFRRLEKVGWKLKGRLDVSETVRNFSRGRFDGFYCRIYDDRAFDDYASVLVATADEISNTLVELSDFAAPILPETENCRRLIASKFRQSAHVAFSYSKLVITCRPPFPIGLKELLYECLRFWMWKGAFALDFSGAKNTFWMLALRADQLFERYVGDLLNGLDPEFIELDSSDYHYKVCTTPLLTHHEVNPDYVRLHVPSQTILVVDAKYRTDFGTAGQVYQLIAYMNYVLHERNRNEKCVGILVYPGEAWKTFQVEGFGNTMYCVTVPVSKDIDFDAFNSMVRGCFEDFVNVVTKRVN